MKKISFVVFVTLIMSSCNSVQEMTTEKTSEKSAKTTDFDTQITEKYWKLIILEGKEVKMAENQEREVYFTLKTTENKIQGFAGCNTFNGEYSIEKGQRIRFSPLATTMKACPDVNFNETDYLKVFEMTDNYTIKDDTLRLNIGRRAPLAAFKAVYFN